MVSAEYPSVIDRKRMSVELIAALFFIASLASFTLLIVLILTNSAITGATSPQQALWNLVQSLGILRPTLMIFVGILLLNLSFRLRRGEIGAARWALLVLNWMMFIFAMLLIYSGVRAGMLENVTARTVTMSWLPWAIVLLVLFAIRQYLRRSMVDFWGDEDILNIRTRNAWNLLAPTILVILLIAVTPLEEVFITSLTDERFASSQEVTFVGFENYNRLWSVRLDSVPCEKDAEGACLVETDEFGRESIVYPRPRRFFPEDSEYAQLRYRDFASFNFLGQHFVLSARDTEFIQSLFTSVYYTILAIFFQFTIGFCMAMIIAQRVRGIGIMRVVMLVPMAIPTLIATQFWDVMLRPNETGLINNMLMNLNFISEPQQWLLNPALQVPTLVAVIVWKETPITALLMLPGLLAIPNEVYQAASIDGANRWQRFWSITLPMMRPTIGVTLVLRTMLFLRVFDLFEILVGRTRFVMATYAHDALIQRQQLGYASAISVTIFIITMFFTVAYMRTLRIDEA